MIGAVIHPITVKMDNNERISGQDDSSLFLFPAINYGRNPVQQNSIKGHRTIVYPFSSSLDNKFNGAFLRL